MSKFNETFGALNRGRKYKFDTEELKFVAISEVYEKEGLNIFPLRGFVKSTAGDYGDSYAFITPVGLISAKPNMHEQIIPVHEGAQELIDMINNEEVYIQFNEFEYTRKTKNGEITDTSYGMRYLDLDEVNELESQTK